MQKTYTNGSLSETRHYYSTHPATWQVLEERVGTSPDSANAERQFVWNRRYIDGLILRDRDNQASLPTDQGGRTASAIAERSSLPWRK